MKTTEKREIILQKTTSYLIWSMHVILKYKPCKNQNQRLSIIKRPCDNELFFNVYFKNKKNRKHVT